VDFYKIGETNNLNSNSNKLLISEEIRSLIVGKRRARTIYNISRLLSHKSTCNKLANSLKKNP